MPLVEFPYNNNFRTSIGMTPYEALYGRKCRSPICWDDVGERKLLGLDLVQVTIENIWLIQERLKTTQSRPKKKTYAGNKRRELKFQVGDHVFLKVSLMKNVMRFGKKGKFSPKHVGPFEVLEKVGAFAYRVTLPPKLGKIHNVFHVLLLRKYVYDASHVVQIEPIQLNENLAYEEYPIWIVDTRDKILHREIVKLVKVQWSNHEE